MSLRIGVVTLGVADLDRSVRFYRDGLGLAHRDDRPPVAYFALDGAWLALYPREALARYAGAEPGGEGFDGVTLSCNVASHDAVDEAIARAGAAGARIVTAPTAFSWGGYAGWFADPDDHLWEVVFNPRPFLPGDASSSG